MMYFLTVFGDPGGVIMYGERYGVGDGGGVEIKSVVLKKFVDLINSVDFGNEYRNFLLSSIGDGGNDVKNFVCSGGDAGGLGIGIGSGSSTSSGTLLRNEVSIRTG